MFEEDYASVRKIVCPKCGTIVLITEEEIDHDSATCDKCNLRFRVSQSDREALTL